MADWDTLAAKTVEELPPRRGESFPSEPRYWFWRILVFGCCLRVTWVTSLAVGLFLAGCSEKKAHDLAFRVSFACSADQEAADELQLRVLQGGCDGSQTVYEATLAKGDEAPSGKGIAAGNYGFAATALSDSRVLASSCVEVTLPGAADPEIRLQSADCDPPALPDDAGEESDAGEPTASEDGGGSGVIGRDASADANGAALTCATDCKDLFPCTDDRCVDGECVHDPYTGARECDGVVCTEQDRCESGSCTPGTPNHAACPDDGNPCTAETCEATTGCNRNGASGGSCSDQVECTSADTCVNGVCRGADMCSGGAVCSAASGTCSMCLGPEDCDDRDPCTTDTCSSGACSSVRNVGASCSDGKSCTSNDLCTATACVGTSTCSSDATCGGSLCRCNDSSKTLCNNACIAIATSTQNCGQCGRMCGTGATCQNSACKPSGATNCTAYRYGGHDYLICTDTLRWDAARDRCRSWGLGLVIIDTQAENDFLKGNNGNADHWIAANDRGDDGRSKGFSNSDQARSCTLNGEEGKWYWTRPAGNANGDDSGDNFQALCAMASDTATSCTLVSPSTFQNWNVSEPNNDGCNCGFGNCSEGEDCGQLYADGTWNDGQCSSNTAFICESL